MCCGERFAEKGREGGSGTQNGHSLSLSKKGFKQVILCAYGCGKGSNLATWNGSTISFVVVAAGVVGYLRVKQGQYVPLIYELNKLKEQLGYLVHLGYDQIDSIFNWSGNSWKAFSSWIFGYSADQENQKKDQHFIDDGDDNCVVSNELPLDMEPRAQCLDMALLDTIIEEETSGSDESSENPTTPRIVVEEENVEVREEDNCGRDDAIEVSDADQATGKSSFQSIVEKIPGVFTTWTFVSAADVKSPKSSPECETDVVYIVEEEEVEAEEDELVDEMEEGVAKIDQDSERASIIVEEEIVGESDDEEEEEYMEEDDVDENVGTKLNQGEVETTTFKQVTSWFKRLSTKPTKTETTSPLNFRPLDNSPLPFRNQGGNFM